MKQNLSEEAIKRKKERNLKYARNNKERMIRNTKKWLENPENKEKFKKYNKEYYSDPDNMKKHLETCKRYRLKKKMLKESKE